MWRLLSDLYFQKYLCSSKVKCYLVNAISQVFEWGCWYFDLQHKFDIQSSMKLKWAAGQHNTVGCGSDWRARGPAFNTRFGYIFCFSFRWFKKGICQLLAKSMCRKYWLTTLEVLVCPGKVWLVSLTVQTWSWMLTMEVKQQTNNQSNGHIIYITWEILIWLYIANFTLPI